MLSSKLKNFINKKNGNFFVIGPPGTGKTHTLIDLTRYLIKYKHIEPTRILIFSFNRRWAKIIREKTAIRIESSILEIPIESFFSFCLDFLNKEVTFLNSNIESIEILNSIQQWNLLRDVINNLGKKNYPHTLKYFKSNPFISSSFMQEVFDFILRAQENLLSPKKLSDKFTPFFNPILSEIVGIYANYKKELYKNNIYNYGRLLEDTVNILEDNKGNDDESIYTFRGSMVDNFKKVYVKIKPENILFLRNNYRNSPAINALGNKFICQNKDRVKKKSIILGMKQEDINGEVVFRQFSTSLDEVNFITTKIKNLLADKNIKLEDICVIIKGLGYETHIIENVFAQNGIPFIRKGTRTILDNKFVKYIIYFLKFLLLLEEYKEGKYTNINIDPQKYNFYKIEDYNLELNGFLERIMLSEIINIGPVYFKKIKSANKNLWSYLEKIYSSNINTKRNKNNSIKNIQTDQKEGNGLEGQDYEIDKIVNFVLSVYKFLPSIGESVYNFILKFINDENIGIVNYLLSENKESVEIKNVWDSLGDYLESVKEFSKDNNSDDCVRVYIEFLDSIINNQFLEEVEESTRELGGAGAVNVLSYHQCKGFEFKVVFLPFINRDYLPSRFNFPQSYDMQIFNYFSGGKILDAEELRGKHMEEERKLFYTGITRAKDYLYITASKRKERSIFFEEVDNIFKELLQKNLKGRCKLKALSTYAQKKNNERIDFNNNWLVRKRAIVGTYRLAGNLHINIEGYLKKLFFLKYFYPQGKWWVFAKTTVNKNNPFKVFPVSFSYSSIASYKECPLKYKLRHYLNIEEEKNINILVGRIYHKILRLFFEPGDKKEKILSRKRLEMIIRSVFDENDFEFEYIKRELLEKAVGDFKSYYENYLPLQPHKSIMEKKFLFNINGETIKGRIDQINFIDNGHKDGGQQIEIVEFKSGSTRLNKAGIDEEIQLKLYRLAIELSKDLSFLKSKNYILKYIFLGALKNPISEITEENYDLKQFSKLMLNLITKIRKEEFAPNPESYISCMNCDYKILCKKYYGG
jgi:DNA helicase-2/ATP-dependent DNA helicase PcrA